MVTNTISSYRKDKRITQEELARAIGVTRQTIIAIEKGNYTPSVELALKMSRYFKIAVNELFALD